MLTESEQLDLANKAADFLPCTLEYVYNLKVIINTINDLATKNSSLSTIEQLSKLGDCLADEYHNTIDSECEEFEKIRQSLRIKL
jgi:hypothetical protein